MKVTESIIKKYIPMTETTYYTLCAVKEPRHGYAIMQFVSQLTEKRIQLGTGTLYTMLGRLLEDGIIQIVSEEKGKKTYLITKDGILLMLQEIKRLRHQLENGVEVFGQELLKEKISGRTEKDKNIF